MRQLSIAVALTVACLAGAAQAAVQVHVVQNDPTPGDASVVPSSTLPSADFISPDINFNTGSSDTTPLSTFLNNPTFFNVSNGFDPSKPTDNTFIEITAQTYLNVGNNSFVVGHDDGVVLTFADPSIGTVVNAPGPTGFFASPFNVNVAAAGFYAFDLKYTECCGGPANLVFQINGAPIGNVPEPASLALLGGGLASVAALRRRRKA